MLRLLRSQIKMTTILTQNKCNITAKKQRVLLTYFAQDCLYGCPNGDCRLPGILGDGELFPPFVEIPLVSNHLTE